MAADYIQPAVAGCSWRVASASFPSAAPAVAPGFAVDEGADQTMDLYSMARPALRLMDPERAHSLAIWALERGLAPKDKTPDDPALSITLWGRHFSNPVGLAAGFDKDARAMAGLFDMGLGFVEVGSITPRAQPGNPSQRVFRLDADMAVINRLGFNSQGQDAAAERLARWRASDGIAGVLGINLGKNKDALDAAADYASGARRLSRYADYLVVNVSSPNTPGLRDLQGETQLIEIVTAVRDAMADGDGESCLPLLIKVAPDLEPSDVEAIANVVLSQNIDGVVATNTTITRPAGLKDPQQSEQGGLSGRPLFAKSTEVLGQFYRCLEGRVPLIGVGGVSDGADAYAKIRAGASLVQLYTGMVFGGPRLIGEIKRDLAVLLKRDGFTSVNEAVGADWR